MATKFRDEDSTANVLNSRSVRITASYSDYRPPFAVEPIIQRMLQSVPERYLSGLSEVVLTDTSGMNRKRRRSVTQSRKSKFRSLDALGLYHPAWSNQPAWIEILVDNSLRTWERGIWLKFPIVRELAFVDVFFHEI